MPTTKIPDPDHLLRHVKTRLLEKDPNTGVAIGLMPQAFELQSDEDGLSASWVEFFEGLPAVKRAAAMEEFASIYGIKKDDRFALGVVDNIKEACARFDVKVRVIHDGDGYPSHASVRRLGGATFELLDLLASEAWAQMVTPTAAALQITKARAKARRGK